MTTVDTDYLVVGAGLAGMAFADSLIADSDADVVVVDRRHQPGGHWNDAYAFCRLHMPSANYGVNSRELGRNTIDDEGPNAGLYARATGPEVCAYFHQLLEEQLVPTGQVRFFGMSDYVTDGTDGHRFVSLLSGRTTTVRVRRAVVDATYLESSVPSRHRPSYEIDPDVRLVPPNDLVWLPEAATGYTVIGAGKTAMDTCQWLLDNGVGPDAIRWIRPRDGWFLNRLYYQPLDQVSTFIEGQARQVEEAAHAETVREFFDRLEATEQLLRLDPTVEPTMFHGASVSVAEQRSLQQIENVVQMGKVLHLGATRITLEKGTIPTDTGQVHVDCTAAGITARPARPVFEDGRITLQQVRRSQPSINAAILGHIEGTRDSDEEKNRLSPANPYHDTAHDWIPWMLRGLRSELIWARDPDIRAWLEESRLNIGRGLGDRAADPRVRSARTRLRDHYEAALANLDRLRRAPADAAV